MEGEGKEIRGRSLRT